eukprot:m.27779 g.27779  ORF g.27779 m.27779 type:complete len:328 (-) comp4455_c0_seq1:237-1220(-)
MEAADFELGRRIGRGAFACVYITRERKSKVVYAVKVVKLDKCKERIETFLREVQLLRQCRNPFIVKYFCSFLNDSELWILMEHVVGGSAHNVMRKCRTPYPEAACAVILHDSLEGLAYLHAQGHTHMDIKPGNMLLTADGRVKLCDLGVAKGLSAAQKADPDAVATDQKSTKMAGTLLYMSPEMVLRQPAGHNTDIWSLGITAIELATDHLPRGELHQMKAIWMTAHHLPPTLEGKFSSAFKDFVTVCLVKDPRLRPQSAALLKHKFVKGQTKSSKLVAMVRKAMQAEEAKKRPSRDSSSSSDDDEDYSSVMRSGYGWGDLADDWIF